MTFSIQMRSLVQAWKNSLQSLRQAQILLLFAGYALIQIAVLLALVFYAYPPFSSFFVPIMTKLFGERALHYPNNYIVLPTLFTWANLILSGFIGIVIVGAGTSLFSMKFSNKQVRVAAGLREIAPRYLVLFVAWLIETALITAIFFATPGLIAKIFVHSSEWMVQLLSSCFAILVGAMFAYTTALIVLEKTGVFSAVGKSLSLFIKFPVISLLLIALPNLIKMPLEFLSGKTQFLISKFNPEMVGILLALSVIISIFANYFLVGTVTRFFLLLKDRKIFLT